MPESTEIEVVAKQTEASGTYAMAMLTDDEFEQRLAALRRGAARISRVKMELMRADVHYGKVPGTDKLALMKPGAEMLCQIYGLVANPVPTITYGDGTTAPPITVSVRVELHRGALDGPVVGIGVGAATSWERKHRYRRGERTCPECGVVGSVIKGKSEFGGGWLCWKGGCGAKWDDGAAVIEQQPVGNVENKDQYDLLNTLVKMATKRGHVDAALRATASSDLFTQDVDEEQHDVPQASGTTAPAPTASKFGDAPNWKAVRKLACPACGKVGPLRDSKPEKGGGYYCSKKEGGCGIALDWNGRQLVERGVAASGPVEDHDITEVATNSPQERRAINADEWGRLLKTATAKGVASAAALLNLASAACGEELKTWKAIPLEALPEIYAHVEGRVTPSREEPFQATDEDVPFV